MWGKRTTTELHPQLQQNYFGGFVGTELKGKKTLVRANCNITQEPIKLSGSWSWKERTQWGLVLFLFVLYLDIWMPAIATNQSMERRMKNTLERQLIPSCHSIVKGHLGRDGRKQMNLRKGVGKDLHCGVTANRRCLRRKNAWSKWRKKWVKYEVCCRCSK